MHDISASLRSRVRVTLTLLWALVLYWLVIFPRVRRELGQWRARARTIPDPILRAHALHKLHTEHLTAEGAAAFAILSTAAQRAEVVRLCVAFEVMYDFLDALAEQRVADVLANNLQLYTALATALAPGTPHTDYYAHHPQRNDCGYLISLVDTCRFSLERLCSQRAVLPSLARLAHAAREAQSLHHLAESDGCEELIAWAEARRPDRSDLNWWEIAAAAGSPLGFFALAAAATHVETTNHAAARIERAYFPWIAALAWLLESLVDHGDDASGAHSYIAHYPSPHAAAERLAVIARRAAADLQTLPQREAHVVLLAGMASMYLSHHGASEPAAQAAADAVRRTIGGPITPLLAVLRLRRRLTRLRAARERARPGRRC